MDPGFRQEVTLISHSALTSTFCTYFYLIPRFLSSSSCAFFSPHPARRRRNHDRSHAFAWDEGLNVNTLILRFFSFLILRFFSFLILRFLFSSSCAFFPPHPARRRRNHDGSHAFAWDEVGLLQPYEIIQNLFLLSQ